MRILLVGAGGVGTAFARIAARRAFAELVIADYDLGRAQRAAAARDGYQAVRLEKAIGRLIVVIPLSAMPAGAGPKRESCPKPELTLPKL